MTQTPPRRAPATRLRPWRIAFVVGLALLLGVAIFVVLLSQRGKGPPVGETGATGTDPGWTASQLKYDAILPEPAPATPAPVDTLGPKLAALMARLAQMEAELAELKNRKPTQTTVVQQRPVDQPVPARPTPMLFVSHEIKDAPPVSKEPLYLLAPGATKLPCEVETVVNSDVEGYFTAKVTTNVYDTATRRHLLVPQGSTILGHDQSKSLIYGDTRMDTISLTLTLPNGQHYDLGRAPVTDQLGVAGLTGDVNNHFMRLFGAVLIGGALKGGITAMQTAMTTAGGAGQVTSGISSLGNQATSTVVQPYINTRPTIITASGQLCHVLLIKALSLPASWE
jgi:hypothetical protein